MAVLWGCRDWGIGSLHNPINSMVLKRRGNFSAKVSPIKAPGSWLE